MSEYRVTVAEFTSEMKRLPALLDKALACKEAEEKLRLADCTDSGPMPIIRKLIQSEEKLEMLRNLKKADVIIRNLIQSEIHGVPL